HWAGGEPADAVGLFARSLAIEQAHIEENLARGSEREHRLFVRKFEGARDMRITLALALGEAHEAGARMAAEAVVLGKALAAGATQAVFRRNRRQMALFSAVQSTQAELAQASYREGVSQEAKRTLQTRLEGLERQLAAVGQSTEADTRVSLAGLGRLLSDTAAVVEWVVYDPFDPKEADQSKRYGDPHLAAVVIRKGHAPRWFGLGPLKRLTPVIDRLSAAAASPRGGYVALAQAVHAAVFAPLAPALEGVDTLILSPDGPLHRVPFSALVDAEGAWLLTRYALRTVTTSRDLFDLAQQTLPPREGPLLVADAAFDRKPPRGSRLAAADKTRGGGAQRSSELAGLSGFSRLPGTRGEVQAVATLLEVGRDRTLTKAQATETAVKGVKGPSILHIATHGFFLPDQAGDGDKPTRTEDPMLRSGLALAGFNHRARATTQDDGVLTALEVAGLDLYGTQLVVLSACETGLGKVDQGEGVYGLRRALVLSGARSQVVSLWKVDDAATQALMTAFYTRLMAGEDRVAALRGVQRDMLEGRLTAQSRGKRAKRGLKLSGPRDDAGPDLSGWRHPYYWASFGVSGADGPVVFE
ncbi:MAG: CHAT domain-containing protein, partial [Myxococcota bacterium]|nr:CHAT domain-containing protein [Myxococcota bacterium]